MLGQLNGRRIIVHSTLWQRFPLLNSRLCEETASLHFSWVLLTLLLLLTFIPSSPIPAQEFMAAETCANSQWLQLMPLWNSQSSALKATSPTKHWLTWPAACQELKVSARNTRVDLDLFPVPHCHPWVQHHQLHLSPYQSKTCHKSPTPLKFPLFSWPAATSNLQ